MGCLFVVAIQKAVLVDANTKMTRSNNAKGDGKYVVEVSSQKVISMEQKVVGCAEANKGEMFLRISSYNEKNSNE